MYFQYYWFSGTVLGFDPEMKRSTIQYDYVDDDEEDDDADDEDLADSISEEPVMDDYVNGDVRVLI